MILKESTKWTMWNCPKMCKAKCLVPSFSLITQFSIILDDVFTTTSMNLIKFSRWNEMFGTLYFLYKSIWYILTIAMEPHVDEDIFGMCKHWQNAWQAQDCTNITQIHQIGLGCFHRPIFSYHFNNQNLVWIPNPLKRCQHNDL